MPESTSPNDSLRAADDVEVVIGVVAPLGSDVKRGISLLERSLRGYGYQTEIVRLSAFLAVSAKDASRGYYQSRMDAGDALRERVGRRDILAGLAIAKMFKRDEGAERRKAWILRTLKDDAEAQLLKQVYGSRFVLIAISSDEEDRIDRVTAQLLDETPSDTAAADRARQLVHRDQRDEQNPFGQRVRDAFSVADIFVELNSGTSEMHARESFDRLVGLLFGWPFLTPTVDEATMFHAYAASLRSADAGRQVGAVIAQPRGEVLAVGSNEVPRAGGGEYWYGDEPDGRDFMIGHDFNKRQIARLVKEMLDALAEDFLLRSDLNTTAPDARFEQVWNTSSKTLGRARVTSLIEFGRVVHAEMSALMQAARIGVSVRGAVLYTTTFPCHLCMRLIISAGIKEVVYVDPYPKSLAIEMYKDSLDDTSDADRAFTVRAFEGVGWSLYRSLFSRTNRRRGDDGQFDYPDPVHTQFRLSHPSSLIAEEQLEVAAYSSVLAAIVEADATDLIDPGSLAELQPEPATTPPEIENEEQR